MNNDISIRNWMSACPYVNPSNVSRTGKLEYGIYPDASNTKWRENVLGEVIPAEVQEVNFIFTAKRYYNGARAEYRFFTDIVSWINEQNKRGNFPTIQEGIVKSVVPELSQYVSEPNREEERCEIHIRVSYKPYNT